MSGASIAASCPVRIAIVAEPVGPCTRRSTVNRLVSITIAVNYPAEASHWRSLDPDLARDVVTALRRGLRDEG